MYERIVSSYVINNIDLTNYEKIFSMSYEEITKNLQVRERKIITKKELSQEDKMYNEEVFIITRRFVSNEDFTYRDETTKENITNSINYLILTLFMGIAIKYGKDKTFKFYVRDYLTKQEGIYHMVNVYERQDLEKSLLIKKQNIDLLTGKLDKDIKIKKRGR